MSALETLKLLADPTRLRIMNLILREELAVAELQKILDMGQSRISSHLSLLRQGSLVIDRKDGKSTFYALNERMGADERSLLDAAAKAATELPEVQEDIRNLERAMEQRRRASEEYFNRVAGRLGENYCPGRSWEAMGHALLRMVPEIVIADLGAGEGMMAQLLAPQAKHIYCVDNSPSMVKVGATLAQKQGIKNVEYILGDLEKVPLKAGSVDLALLSQALHHAMHPVSALKEAHRILKPGGSILVLDLLEHSFERARELYADQWLGFRENTLYQILKDTGFTDIDISVVAKEENEPHFETILASARKSD